MEDVFVDVDADIDIDIVDTVSVGDDEFIDVRDVVISRSYGDSDGRRKPIRYDAYNRPINDKPSDYVSFRYSRYDRYGGPRIIRNPVMDEFRKSQSLIDDICSSSKSDRQKRQEVRVVVNQLIQYLRSKNIRYRNLWRHLDTYTLFAPKQIW